MINRRKTVLVVGTIAFFAVCFIMHSFFPFVGNVIYDWNFSLKSEDPPDSVVIVGIDVRSISEIGGFPWPRSTMASLIERIESCAPRTVALDFLFPKRPEDKENDSLANVFGRVSRLVLPFRAGSISKDANPAGSLIPKEAFNHRFLFLANKERLENCLFYSTSEIDIADSLFAVHSNYSGFLNVSTQKSSQKLREVLHVIQAGDEYFPSFGLAAVAAFYGLKAEEFKLDGAPAVILGSNRVPLTSYAGTVFLNFRGRSGTIPIISACDVLNGKIDPGFLRDKLVFVGMTDPAAAPDFFITPVGTQFPGVEVWATAAADLIEKSWIKLNDIKFLIANWILAIILFPGFAAFIPNSRKWFAVTGGIVLVVLSTVLSMALFKNHIFWNPEFHFYAWIFSLIWLAAQKIDPTLVEVAGLELEPVESADVDTLPPPAELDFLLEIPSTDTMSHVVNKLKFGEVGAGKAQDFTAAVDGGTQEDSLRLELVRKVRELAGGQIIRVLGCGGMADVYLVWNPRLDVYRAVKVIKPGQSDQLMDRFETEIRIFANLSQQNIVQFYNAGEWHGLPYLEMEFVPGVSMYDVLKKCNLITSEQALVIGILVCRALHYAHSKIVTVYGKTYKGVIHRDLKPANIMLSRSGRIKLTDFGIARPKAVSIHTADSGKVVGTLPYLAPEQLDGTELTPKTDIYALGATLYELVTGVRAFPQAEITTLINAKSKGDIKSLRNSTLIPKEFAGVIEKSMSTKPQNRFESAQAMGRALESVLRSIADDTGKPFMSSLVKRYWN